ncbi:calpain-7-like isoform X1 [Myzus persicae]|uniref:calpain-7-like isoform X1 n=1 Tax=Myzus persicae TaxID=13164 RepID=UPI000B936E7A|nr:calpain-7-like isoform X1 [Myzus persicae]
MEYAEEAIVVSNKAVDCDCKGQMQAAVYYYREAATLLELAWKIRKDDPLANEWCQKSHDYANRAEALEYQIQNEAANNMESINQDKVRLKQCKYLLKQALDIDESGKEDLAIDSYTQAIELSLKVKKEISDDEMIKNLTTLIENALDRAEKLKQSKESNLCNSSNNTAVIRKKIVESRTPKILETSKSDLYTESEKRVLLFTSKINNKEYVPFMDVDLLERFQLSIPFTDSDGLLTLSSEQKQKFVQWIRPDQLCSDPKMVVGDSIDFYSIKQTIVTDCSFVASLAVCAVFEKTFKQRLITSIIYPQKHNGQPVYNPFGKYMVKFHLNGIQRKVIIDDLLPVGQYNSLLCSHSSNKNEFWVSLIEKAYLKVMGGYDFPGSSSNIDLHALTGWIPERCAIRLDEKTFNADGLFDTLYTRLCKGDVLITVATGPMSAEEERRTGLVSSHAYAVLAVQKVNDLKLLKLKNPWAHVRWKGRYSELDEKSWTPQLRKKLDYDPTSAATFDNGIFWIDYTSVIHHFDVFCMNWNPAIFPYTSCIHKTWNTGTGPISDLYNITENPQFFLDVGNINSGAVWILLTRHITELQDFKENREYISVLVYKNNGKRVHYPNDPEPYISGTRINSPHYLCKIVINNETPSKYTLVVSQYEKMNTINYTLRAYATCPFTMKELSNSYNPKFKTTVNGEWKGIRAGGCLNHSTYSDNPKFKLTVDGSSDTEELQIELKAPKQYQVGVEISCVGLNNTNATAKFKSKSSGSYRSGYVILELADIQPGTYELIPSTYLPGKEGPFILTVNASCSVSINQIR